MQREEIRELAVSRKPPYQLNRSFGKDTIECQRVGHAMTDSLTEVSKIFSTTDNLKGEETMEQKKRFTQGIKQCYHCGKSTVLGNFCTECGEMTGVCSIELEVTKCHKCGEEVPARNYCLNCGEYLLMGKIKEIERDMDLCLRTDR